MKDDFGARLSVSLLYRSAAGGGGAAAAAAATAVALSVVERKQTLPFDYNRMNEPIRFDRIGSHEPIGILTRRLRPTRSIELNRQCLH